MDGTARIIVVSRSARSPWFRAKAVAFVGRFPPSPLPMRARAGRLALRAAAAQSSELHACRGDETTAIRLAPRVTDQN
jgi:hypothetical protein